MKHGSDSRIRYYKFVLRSEATKPRNIAGLIHETRVPRLAYGEAGAEILSGATAI